MAAVPPAGNTIASRSADPIPPLVENTCCRCLRRAYEYEVGSCDAVFDENGYMLHKCSNCSEGRSDCVSVPVRREVIELANDLLNLRRDFPRAVRRGLSLGDPVYVPLRRLIKRSDAFDGVLTAHQRAVDHLGGHSKPNELEVQKDQAKSLRGINQTLTGIYDVMRSAAGLPPLDRPSPGHPLSESSSSSSDNEDFGPDFAGFGPHSSDDDDDDDDTIRPSPVSPPLPSESSLSSSSLETDFSGFDEDADDEGDEEGSG